MSIVIVNWNTRDLLRQCLQSICTATEYVDYEIIVVDNGSQDGSVEMLHCFFPQVRTVLNRRNLGFARANNKGIALCKGRYALLLNSDTKVMAGSIEKMVRFMDGHPGAGLCGVRLVNPDYSFQASYSPFPSLLQEFFNLSAMGRLLIRTSYPSYGAQHCNGAVHIKGYVEGACMMARREAIDQIGGLDERLFMYAEDVDWCYRFARAGWQVWYLPHVAIIHYGGQSSKKQRSTMEIELYRSRVYFFDKHYSKHAVYILKIMIYALTLLKMVAHAMFGSIAKSRGRDRDAHFLKNLHGALGSATATSE